MGISQTPQAIVPASVGGMTLLSTTSLSGTDTTVSSISGSYKGLYIVFNKVYASANGTMYLRFNSDTGSNYHYGIAQFTAPFEWNTNLTSTSYAAGVISTNSGDNTSYSGIITIPRYTENDVKFVQTATLGKYSSVSDGRFTMCNYDSSTAISSISFLTLAATTFSGGTVYIYGVS